MVLVYLFKIATKNLDNQITDINSGLDSSVGMANRFGAGQMKERGSVPRRGIHSGFEIHPVSYLKHQDFFVQE